MKTNTEGTRAFVIRKSSQALNARKTSDPVSCIFFWLPGLVLQKMGRQNEDSCTRRANDLEANYKHKFFPFFFEFVLDPGVFN